MQASRFSPRPCLASVAFGFVFAAATCAASDEDADVCAHAKLGGFERSTAEGERVAWQDERAANPASWVRFRILGFNDFHGQLEPRTCADRPVGGAAVLASYLQAESTAAGGAAIIVHAGDQVGASPPISALLQDEPSITFLNLLANDQCRAPAPDGRRGDSDPRLNPGCNLVGALGNHEFDEGVDEMLRLINGGTHTAGPFLQAPYRGAEFPYVAANVVDKQSGEPIVSPYVIKRIKGQAVGFIGAVVRDTPTIVTPTGVAGVQFLDEATAINKYVRELQAQGVRAIVVTIHQGTRQRPYGGTTRTDPVDLGGDIGPIIEALDDEVDVVVAGHWHDFTNALMRNRNGRPILVTQAYAAATAYAAIDLAIDPVSADIVYKTAEIVTTWADAGPGLAPHADVAAVVSGAADRVERIVRQEIGEAATAITRAESSAGESALGNLIADAQRAAMQTDIAFVNPGGIRDDLASGIVRWGTLFTILPFNDDLVRMDLSGAQIIALLNQQWDGQTFPRVMKSSGIRYSWNANAPASERVVPDSIKINGRPLQRDATYSVTVNSFLAAGGDNFTVLKEGKNRVTAMLDIDALIAYVQSLPQPFTATIDGRIRRIP